MPDMASPDYGRRLLPSLVDEIAAECPDRPFASIPNTIKPEDGFQNINFGALARAINRCSWWIEALVGKGNGFPTIAYMGPQDVLYLILVLACIKTGYKVRTSRFNPLTVRPSKCE